MVGPHRDDLEFQVDGTSLASFGSRGQQRLAVLALKLAEARFMTDKAGEEPILLLADILSELDAPRREYLLSAVGAYGQVVLTTADLGCVGKEFLARTTLLDVVQGTVHPPGD